MTRITIYDTTLRDGSQGEGVNFSLLDKLNITRRLDERYAHEDFVAAECAARASRQFLGRLNDLSPDRRVRRVTFYPCRYDCAAASSYAAAAFSPAATACAPASRALRAAPLCASRPAGGDRLAPSTRPRPLIRNRFPARPVQEDG